MTILNKITTGLAASALSFSILTPVAMADRGDRRYHNSEVERSNRADRRAERRGERRANRSNRSRPVTRGVRGNYGGGEYGNTRRGERRTDRREARRRAERRAERRFERRADRREVRRRANRVENRQIRRNAYNNGYRQARRDTRRHSGFRYHQPRRVYHSRPRHYRPYYSRPSHARVIYGRYHRPHYRYTPRYRIGGFYGYHRNSIIINDYWAHGLYDPPRGYHWVRDHDTGDAILASVATGAIIGLIIGALSY